MSVAADLDLLGAAGNRADNRPLDYWRPTGPQAAWMAETHPCAIWRDANQIGKTYGLLLDLIHRCRGTGPHAWRRPPIRALVLSVSHEQMGTTGGFHEKLWGLLPKDEIDPDNGFEPGRGITGKPPRIVFVSGPGAGSVISFATYKQGAQRVAGPTVDIVLLDEPPPYSIFEEITPRLFQRGGLLRAGFTVTMQAADLSYLQKGVEEGRIREHNYGMTESSLWPQGRLRPLKTEAQIRAFEESLPSFSRDMRMGRSWSPMLTGRWLTNFTDDCVRAETPPHGAQLGISIDHGANAGKQVAELVAIAGRDTARPRVWWWDEAGSDGATTPEQDCEAIFAMLERNRLAYSDIDWWVGDRATGRDRWGTGKSNRDLRAEIGRKLKIPVEDVRRLKPIDTIKKWDGSVEYGIHLMNTLFGRRDDEGRPHGVVHPRCERLIAGCRTWKGDRRDPVKDALDAGRYGVQHGIDRRFFDFAGIKITT